MVTYFEQMSKEEQQAFIEEIRVTAWIKENADIEYTKYVLRLSDKEFWDRIWPTHKDV